MTVARPSLLPAAVLSGGFCKLPDRKKIRKLMAGGDRGARLGFLHGLDQIEARWNRWAASKDGERPGDCSVGVWRKRSANASSMKRVSVMPSRAAPIFAGDTPHPRCAMWFA